MRRFWIALAVTYIVGAFACMSLFLWPAEVNRQPTLESRDWELVWVCVWERWDPGASYEETARLMQFCVEVFPFSGAQS